MLRHGTCATEQIQPNQDCRDGRGEIVANDVASEAHLKHEVGAFAETADAEKQDPEAEHAREYAEEVRWAHEVIPCVRWRDMDAALGTVTSARGARVTIVHGAFDGQAGYL